MAVLGPVPVAKHVVHMPSVGSSPWRRTSSACGCPIVTGPSVFNFQEAATLAQQAGAAFPVASMAQGVQLAVELAQDEVRFAQARAAAEQFATAHRGAADRTAQAVQTLLSSPR